MISTDKRFTVCIEHAISNDLDALIPKGSRTEIVRIILRKLALTLDRNPDFLFLITGHKDNEDMILTFESHEKKQRRPKR